MNRWRKPIAILNPKAAGGRVARQCERIAEALRLRMGSFPSRFTEHRGHATALAREALREGCDLIIAVGGDGTVNEVANGFFAQDRPLREDACLAMIPLGTGGDLQRTLGIPAGVDKAIDIISDGEPLTIDLGKAEFMGPDEALVRRYFVNLVSFGMGGDVSVRAKNFLSPLGGKIAFLYATLTVFLTYRGKRVRLTLDGVAQPEEFFITNIAVGNGCYHGGGMHPCPQAVMNDGILEVTTIDRLSMYELIRDLPVLYSNNIYQHPKVRHFRASHIRAESEQTVRIEVDGEALGRLPLEISLLPACLPVLVGRQSPLLRAPETAGQAASNREQA